MKNQPDIKIKEASLILGRHPNSLRKYSNLGLLKSYRDAVGYRRFALRDLLEFKKGLDAFEREGRVLGKKLFWLKQRGNAEVKCA